MIAPSEPNGAGLPIVAQASEPEWVRHGDAATKQSYETALAFEEMLVEELASGLTAGSLGGEEGEAALGGEGASAQEGSSAGFAAMAPRALASAIAQAGGLGLAGEIARPLGGSTTATGAPSTTATGTGGPSTTATGTGAPSTTATGTGAPSATGTGAAALGAAAAPSEAGS